MAEVLAVSHVHSSWSYDGSWSLDSLATTFASRGYRVVLMTEHDRGFSQSRWLEYQAECGRVSTPDLLVVPGLEYSDADNQVHVLVWGPVPFLGEGLPTQEMLERVAAHQGLAVLAHPARRRAWERISDEWIPYLLGIEVWNRKYDGWAPGMPGAALVQATRKIPFVGLDFHSARQLFPLGMALELAGTIDEANVLDSLRHGRCAPRAFGFSLAESRFERRLPLLRFAERGRRRLAAVKRFSKNALSR